MDYPALDTTPPKMDIPTPSMKYSTPSTAGGDIDLYPQTTFSLIYKNLTYTTPLSSNHAVELSQHKAGFLSSLDRQESPNSIESILLRFFQFLLDRQVSTVFITPLVSAFQKDFLILNEIHSVIASLPESKEVQRSLLRIYYTTLLGCGLSIEAHTSHSALFKQAERGGVKLVALFGGQGASNPRCFRELLDIYDTYSQILETLIRIIDNVLYQLCVSPDTYNFFRGREIRLLSWLQNPEAVPSDQFLASAPVSFPIHGLVALAHWFIVCKLLGRTPGDIRSLLGGASGHSQGIVIGAAISASDSWSSFYENSITATKLLFWTGYESHHAAPRVALASAAVKESKSHGEGQPSSMLCVSGLSSAELTPLLVKSNQYLPADRNIYLALSNAKYSHTIAGAASSLLRFTKLVREVGAGRDVDQSRLPFDKRKPVVETQFLPISAPFHTPYLVDAGTRIKNHLSGTSLDVKQLAIPVYDTRDGSNLAAAVNGDLVPYLVDALTVQPVDWAASLSSSSYTHVLAFGKTVADMVGYNVAGKGVQIISATELTTINPQFGSKRELFSPHLSESFLSPRSWEEEFQPRLVRSENGSVKIQTKLTKLLDMPPIMVAGMTPTTVPWDFVSAIINAGYHAELAGGGYFNAETMTAAINKLIETVKPGQGITCNLIYANPQAIHWQIAMLHRLAHNGQPIDGLTIGAGVPSLDIVKEWITTLGLRHISFKPGSEDAIERVLEIAKAHPDFPIIIQWTGGRGGGHHSFEDFHSPILRLYGKIRQYPNTVLVAGSGFGDGEGSYPYLTGTWSVKYGYAKMPFDGILVGSRVMAAKEAHTSLAVKQLICDIPGTHDGKWTDSYKRPVGGIVTVQSEMGQPIHTIASRGVLFWKEMDDTIFSLPRAKQLVAIQKRKAYIIRKLNDDFAKPWFGQNSKGEAVELSNMTYLEVISRLINLTYLPQHSRWIDPSYAGLVGDVAIRSLERLGVFSEIDTSKPEQIKEIFSRKFPQTKKTIIHPEDASWFLERCKRRGQKPTNFVPVLDENFSTWLKKDSLWQSENIESVIDQDPGRICILHGPVAAQYSQQVDEPVGEILGGINNSWIKLLTEEFYKDKEVPIEESSESFFTPNLANINVVEHDQRTTVRASTGGAALPTNEEVLQYLAGRTEGWMRSIFLSDFILQGRTKRSNFFRESFGFDVHKSVDIDRANSKIILGTVEGEKRKTLISLSSSDGVSINAQVIHHIPGSDIPVPLHFKLRYDRTNALFPLSEELQDRDLQIKSFYSRLWLGSDMKNSLGLYSTFGGYRTVLSPEILQQWTCSVGLSHSNDRLVSADTRSFPLNATIIPAWEALVQPLMVPEIDGDLLRLVHLSIEFQLLAGSKPLQVGETVEVTSTIESIVIDDPGKVVTVRAVISRDNPPAVAIISKFLIRGTFPDFTGTFQRSTHPDVLFAVSSSIDNAVLRSRPWLKLDNEDVNLIGETLLFRVQSFSTYKSEKIFKTLRATGDVFIQHPRQGLRRIGHVNFDTTDACGNPVIDFLTRKGILSAERHALENPGWSGPSTQTLKMPFEMEVYARVSKDYNPIHVSPIFAAVANLPGIIVHGMYTSAVASVALDQISNDFNHLRTRRYTVSFVDMVLPGEDVRFKYRHVAMLQGRLVVQIQAFKVATGDRVLEGEAELEQVPTTYLFTGQGSQFQGMGMDLYKSSPVARKIWDNIDRYLLNSYGWSAFNIVQENPKSITIHFSGKRGRAIRDRYLAMTVNAVGPGGQKVCVPSLSGLTPNTRSITFKEPRGLLYTTQFAQPIILILEKATFEDMRAKGFVQEGAMYAGHSLGEFGALSCLAEYLPFEHQMDVAFYRGLTLQNAVKRDESGASDFSMVAVNPGRVKKAFNDAALRHLVNTIAGESKKLLEIVNLNVEGEQYVCTGHNANLHALGEILNAFSRGANSDIALWAQESALSGNEPSPSTITINSLVKTAVHAAHALPTPITLSRGQATIPLQGIDVPFHSSHLRPGVAEWREFLLRRVRVENIRPDDLLGKFVPNLMGRPLSLDREYIAEARKLTGSDILQRRLDEGLAF